jgi:hypothetical protein
MRASDLHVSVTYFAPTEVIKFHDLRESEGEINLDYFLKSPRLIGSIDLKKQEYWT